MRNSIVMFGALALVAACSRDRAPETGSTTVTGASTNDQKPAATSTSTSMQQGHQGQQPGATSTSTSMQQGQQGQQGQLGQQGRDQGQTGAASTSTSMQQGQPMDTDKTGGSSATPSSNKTKTTDAIRNGLKKDKAAPAAVIDALIIRDDGSVVIMSGTVPDDKTHDALLKSAKKSAGNAHVQDNLHVSGK